jgi:hypothetical protein
MNERELDEMKKLLREAMPPVSDAELRRDLWPEMLRKLPRRDVRVPWWDWVLLAAASLLMLFFPGVIPALLYHL